MLSQCSPDGACGIRDDRSHETPHFALLHAGYKSDLLLPKLYFLQSLRSDEGNGDCAGYLRPMAGLGLLGNARTLLPDRAALAGVASKPDFQARLFQNCVDGGFGIDGKGHTKPFVVDRTVPNFVATFALADKAASCGLE
jgi:hypothetical protein